MPKIKRDCETCGKEFTRYVRIDYKRRGHGRFCSRICSSRSVHYGTPGRVYDCRNCGKPVHRSPSQIHPSGNIYCSSRCYADAERMGYKTLEGYVVTYHTGHPMANRGGHMLQHWYVMYERNPDFAIWAKKNKWSIHHKNGRRNDNRDANLEWRAPGKHPRGWTVGDMVDALTMLGYEVRERNPSE